MLEKVWEKGTLLHCWWECKLIQPLWKTVWRFLKKQGIKPPYDPAFSLLDTYPEETKIEKDTCIPLFVAALFTIARTWKQPRCPLTDEWIKKSWYIYTMENYSAIKRNTFESVLMRWLNLEPIIQNFVVFCQTSTWISHRYTYITSLLNFLPSPSPAHSSRLIQSPSLSFLSPTANSYWLSILHMVM